MNRPFVYGFMCVGAYVCVCLSVISIVHACLCVPVCLCVFHCVHSMIFLFFITELSEANSYTLKYFSMSLIVQLIIVLFIYQLFFCLYSYF